MSGKTVVFAVEDKTSYSGLESVIEQVKSEHEVRMLYLDSLFTNDPRDMAISRGEIPYEGDDVSNYITFNYYKTFPSTRLEQILQRLLLDNVSHRIAFKVDKYIDTVQPDVMVSAVDIPPFLRQLIVRSYHRNIRTVVLQHGTYERALDPELISARRFFPNVQENPNRFEYLKRRLGFRYGIAVYCNPYVDTMLSLGDFFTERIKDLRSTYPGFDHTDVVTTGSPEYDADVEPYEAATESLLFLSQHQYEGGNWDWETQEALIALLKRIDEEIPVTVRPHPKASEEKIRTLKKSFRVSEDRSLKEDIVAHDVITTVNSTAIYEGVIRGKVCGTIQLPEYPITQEPFTHDHLIQFGPSVPDVVEEAQARSNDTQTDYLSQFCYMPSVGDGQYKSSLELVVNYVVDDMDLN